jgi:hypothetical protein
MPPRRRLQFTPETVEQQLQQIHLLDPSSSSENLEQLGPIIKQIHQTRQQDAYLRTLQGVIDAKDAEIERICGDNYQDFLASVSTLFTVKSYTNNLRDKINTLDSSVSQVGRGLVEKKRALLQAKKTAANLDEAIDNLQAGLRVLDVVNRVGEMVKEGKYWSALRVCTPSAISRPELTRPVARRSPIHALEFPRANAPVPIHPDIPSFFARPHQGCRHGLEQTMVARDPQPDRPRRPPRARRHGDTQQEMEIAPRARSAPPSCPGGQRCGGCDI